MPSQSDEFVVDPALASASLEERRGVDLNGNDCDPDSKSAVARSVARGSCSRYWVKAMAFGPFAGSLFNPETPGADVASRRNGIEPFKFSEVGPQSFKHYMNFLKTKNTAHLRFAEREMTN